MANDPAKSYQDNVDESFGGRFTGVPGLFESAGFDVPKTGKPASSVPAQAPSLFEAAGFSVPGAKAQASAAPEGGFYVPWLGKSVATADEYQKLLSEHVSTPSSKPETFQDRAQREAGELGTKVADIASRNFWSGAKQISEGMTETKTNRPLGVGKIIMGAANAVPLNALSTAFDVAKDTVNNLTGGGAPNKAIDPQTGKPIEMASLGDRATLFVPGPVGAKIAAKAVPEVNALTKVVEHIAEGGPQAVSNAITTLRKNPTMTAMDVSPNVETTAIAIAKGAPSTGQSTLHGRVGQRIEEAPTNIMNAYDTGLGKTPNTVELLQAFKDNARKVGETQIQPALEKTGPVNITDVIKNIDAQIGDNALRAIRNGDKPALPLSPTQERLLQLRQQLTYRGQNEVLPKRAEYFLDATGAPNAEALDAGAHAIQSRLRVESQSLSKSASGAERLMGGTLGDVRGKLVDAIDKASIPSSNPIPDKFSNLNVKTSSGVFDPTGTWFTRGDKPIYAQATPTAARATLGHYADDLSKFESVSGSRGQSPITVWYKPGERARAEREIELFQNAPGPNASRADQIAYHHEQGLNLGYPQSSVNSYISKRFGEAGPYKTALSSYRDEMDVQNAFERGQEILSGVRTGEKGMANRPEAFRKWVDQASDHEIASARLGARTIIDNYIGTSRQNARAGRDLPEAPFTDAKIKMLFGEQEGKQLLDTLHNERRKATVNSNLVANSVTSRALAGQKEIAPREVGGIMDNAKSLGNALALPIIADVAGGQGLATGIALAAGGISKGYKTIGRAHDIAVNNRYADIASSTEPKMRNALIQALEAKQAQISGGNKPVNALAASLGYLPRP